MEKLGQEKSSKIKLYLKLPTFINILNMNISRVHSCR